MPARLLAVAVFLAASHAVAQTDGGTPSAAAAGGVAPEVPASDGAPARAGTSQDSSDEQDILAAPPVPGVTALQQARLIVGARAGFAFPFGRWTAGASLPRVGLFTEVMDRTYPLQVEAGWRFGRVVTAGVYAQLAPATLRFTCVNSTCNALGLRAGAMAVLRLNAHTRWSAFVIPELGYSQADFTDGMSNDPQYLTVSYRGIDAALSAGADHPMGEAFRLGFFFTVRGGTYLGLGVRMVREAFEPVSEPGLHGFLGAGVRGEYAVF